LEELIAPSSGVQLWTDFLLTYRSIFRPQDVLRYVLGKFSKSGVTDEDEERALQLRVLSFVKFWIEKFWSDFNYDSNRDMKKYFPLLFLFFFF